MKKLAHYRKDVYRQLFRTVDVPEDLAPVTDIDSAAEAGPRQTGLELSSVDTIWEACENLYRSGVYPLLSLCLRRQGEIVLNRSLGHYQEGKIASINTPICLFSASKSVTAVLVHLLEEQGKVNLLNPVSYYIPAFAAKGKGSITLLQLLTHRGGVAGVPDDVELDLLFDHDAALQMVCEAEPTDHQGRVQSHARGHMAQRYLDNIDQDKHQDG